MGCEFSAFFFKGKIMNSKWIIHKDKLQVNTMNYRSFFSYIFTIALFNRLMQNTLKLFKQCDHLIQHIAYFDKEMFH